MTSIATASRLNVHQLQQVANDPTETLRQLPSVLLSLAGSEEEAGWASEALENCGPPTAAQVPIIAAFVKHPAELVASWACKLLARIGHGASPAESELVSVLNSRSEQLVREEAARALGQLDCLSDAARTALTTAAQKGGPRLKRLATASLGG